jgi:hypothetical protein
MSVQILPPDVVGQHLAPLQQSTPTEPLNLRSKVPVLRRPFEAAARAYAKARLPVFPLARLTNVPLKGSRGFHDAATDPAVIERMIERTPAANVGLRTGRASGVLVLDVDPDKGGEETLAALITEHETLPETRTHRTPSGGWHRLFRLPEGVGEVKCSARDGLDVRADGGYAAMPPSVRPDGEYRVLEKSTTMAVAPAWLIEWAQNRGHLSQSPCGGGGSNKPRADITVSLDGPPIPEGERHDTLKSIAGRLFDGDVDRLAANLAALNEARCKPAMPGAEVESIARWFFGKEACRAGSGPGPKGEEVLDLAGGYWYEELLRGGGRSKKRDVFRGLEIWAAKHGRLTTVQEVEGEERRAVVVEVSFREIAEEAKTSAMSVKRNLDALKAEGAILVDRMGKSRGERSKILILEPQTNRYSQRFSPIEKKNADCNTSSLPPRPDRLETPIYCYREHVGNSKGGTQVALEAFGPQTPEEIAERVGITDVGYFVRCHLEPLAKRGIAEERDGVWGLRGDHRERGEESRREKYVTIHRRKMSKRTSEGRRVVWVKETVVDASGFERDEKTRERHRKEREAFRLAGPEGDAECRELLNAWDEERGDVLIEQLQAQPIEVAWPELVDGVVMHDQECSCSVCGDEAEAVA